MAHDFDLILRNTPMGDIGIAEGIIGAIAENLAGSASAEYPLSGKSLFPGFIDAHVHFNEPGRAEWEGFATGSRAIAAGGCTVFCDMPLNSSPPVIDGEAFLKKKAIGEKKSIIDFALWGGLIPGNAAEIPRLAELGAIGLKAFMANSGLEEFPWVTPGSLKEGMVAAARAGLLVAVHAESQGFLEALPKRSSSEGAVRDFLESRPIAAEVEAIRIACELAGETGCQLHIVHVSSREGIAEIEAAKKRGVDVSAETCPHYLFFSEDDMIKLGAIAKCAPPLRKPPAVAALISSLMSGQIDTIGSDHSPSLPEMKSGDFAEAWGGLSSCQHAFPAFLDQFPNHGALLSENPAKRFGLYHKKGSIEVGKDADFTIIDFSKKDLVDRSRLLYRHPISPYIGRTIGCQVVATLSRGRLVYGEVDIPIPSREFGHFLARST